MRSSKFAVAVMALVPIVSSTAPAEPSALDEAIIFVSDRAGVAQLYLTTADGTRLRRLASLPEASDPIPSPDGTRILFNAGERTYVVSTRGDEARPIETDDFVYDASWSPDGRMLAFTDLENAYLADGDGGGVRFVAADVDELAWGPDSARLLVVSRGEAVDIVDIETGERTPISTSGLGSGDISWSPDGRLLAVPVERASGVEEDIAVVDAAAGTEITRVGPVSAHAWAPDAARLLIQDEKRLGVATLTGSVTWLTAAGAVEAAAWSPDGRWIAVSAKPRGAAAEDLFLIDPRSGQSRRLTTSRAGEGAWEPRWSADSGRIVFEWGRFAEGRYLSRDLAVIDVSTGELTPLTDAFPWGGSNGGAAWVRAPRLPETPRLERVRDVTSMAAPFREVVAVDAAGSQAVVYGRERCGGVGVWRPGSRPRRIGGQCYDVGGGNISAAGGRVAWLFRFYDRGAEYEDCLFVWEVRNARARAVTRAKTRCMKDSSNRGTAAYRVLSGYGSGEHSSLGGVEGDGSLLVYTITRSCWQGEPDECRREGAYSATLWRVDGRNPTKIATGPHVIELLDVDDGRVLTRAPGKAPVVLDRRGRVAARLAGEWDGVAEAMLAGEAVYALSDTALERRPIATGSAERRWLLGGPDVTTHLAGVDDEYAVLIRGTAIIVIRLLDDRRVVLRPPLVGPPVTAALTPAGLVYGYNAVRTPRPGRIGFVSRADLRAALEQAPRR